MPKKDPIIGQNIPRLIREVPRRGTKHEPRTVDNVTSYERKSLQVFVNYRFYNDQIKLGKSHATEDGSGRKRLCNNGCI